MPAAGAERTLRPAPPLSLRPGLAADCAALDAVFAIEMDPPDALDEVRDADTLTEEHQDVASRLADEAVAFGEECDRR